MTERVLTEKRWFRIYFETDLTRGDTARFAFSMQRAGEIFRTDMRGIKLQILEVSEYD